MADRTERAAGSQGGKAEVDPIALVREALGKIRFGGIQLTVHEGKLVQIEVTEKRRFS